MIPGAAKARQGSADLSSQPILQKQCQLPRLVGVSWKAVSSAVTGASDLVIAKQKRGQVWVKFGAPEHHISFSKGGVGVARFFEQVLQVQEPIHLL